MRILFRVLGGIVMMAIGAFFVVKTEWFMQNFGSVPWAEEKLGGGGSWLFYKLIGIGIAMIGMLLATGLLGGFFFGTVGRFLVPPGTPAPQ